MPPISSDMFQYSTVMANGGKFATVFHQYWKTMAKNISYKLVPSPADSYYRRACAFAQSSNGLSAH